MAKILRTSFIIAIALLGALSARAQDVKFEVNGPKLVAVGEPFRLEFSLNMIADNFSLPPVENFDLVAGPVTAESFHVDVSSAGVVRTESYTYTYVLIPRKAGNFSIPSATATIKGKEYTTNPLLLEVVQERGAAGQQGAGTGSQPGASQGSQSAGDYIASDDLLLRVIADKTSVYKGEPVRVFYKLYKRVPIAGFDNVKYPTFNGFWVQDLDVSRYSMQRETYNNKIYETEILREYLIYPQQAGALVIEPMNLSAVAQVVVQRPSQSIMDDLFGGIPDIQQVSKRLSTAPLQVNVKDWPAGAPDNFSGAVGSFSMNAEFAEGDIAANTSVNYTLRIMGTGNLPLIQAPHIDVPNSFEQYNIKTTESLNRTGSGISGYRQFEYPLIARAQGTYTIEPIGFTYFDPQNERYVTLQTKEMTVNVLPDSEAGSAIAPGAIVSGLAKEDVRLLGEDIRFIKLGRPQLALQSGMFISSLWYFLALLLIVGLFVFALIYLQKRIKEMRNVDLVRGKRANKVALQRLRAAEKYMKEGSQRNFYEEMLKALWGYMGDKLNIPAASLTKENIREGMLKKGVAPEKSARYIDLISECEYAQYSPEASGQMHEIYRSAVEMISKFESLIKK